MYQNQVTPKGSNTKLIFRSMEVPNYWFYCLAIKESAHDVSIHPHNIWQFRNMTVSVSSFILYQKIKNKRAPSVFLMF